MLQVTVTLTFDLLTPNSVGIIFGQWPSKTPIMVSLSLKRFKLLSKQRFYAQAHCDLDLRPTEPKINRDNIWVMTS